MFAEEASADEPPAEAPPAPLQRPAAIDWVVGFFAAWGVIDVVHGVVPYLTGEKGTLSIAEAGLLPLVIAWGLYGGHSAGFWGAGFVFASCLLGMALTVLFVLGSSLAYLAGKPVPLLQSDGNGSQMFIWLAVIALISIVGLRALVSADVKAYFNDRSRERRPFQFQLRYLFFLTLAVVIGLLTIDLDPRIARHREDERIRREVQAAIQAANGGTPAPTSVPDVSPNGQ